MQLDVKKVPVIFQGGTDSKTATELVAPGSFLTASNVVRTKTGRLQKRYGFLSGTTTSGGGVQMGTASFVKTTSDGKFIMSNHGSIRAYDDASDFWQPIRSTEFSTAYTGGAFSFAKTSAETVRAVAGTNSLTQCIVEGGNHRLIADSANTATSGSSQSFSVTLEDLLSKVRFTVVVSEASVVRLIGTVYINSTFCALAVGPGGLWLYTFDPASPSGYTKIILSSATTYVNGLTCKLSSTSGVVVVNNSVNNDLIIYTYSSTAMITTTSYDPSGGAGGNTADIKDLAADNTLGAKFFITSSYTAATTDQVRAFSGDLLTSSALYITSAIARCRGTYGALQTASSGTLSSRYWVVVSRLDTGVFYLSIRSYTWSEVNGAALSESLRGTDMNSTNDVYGLYSNPVIYDGILYIIVYKYGEADVDRGAFLWAYAPINGVIPMLVSKFHQGIFYQSTYDNSDGDTVSSSPVTNMFLSSTTIKAIVPINTNITALSAAGAYTASVGSSVLEFDLSQNRVQSVEVDGDIYIASGILWKYDGKSIYENGFLSTPTIYTAAVGAAGSLTGTYGVIAVYEWTDDRGVIHRSCPSIPKTVIATADEIDVAFSKCVFSNRVNPATESQINTVIYMTQAGGSVYYKMKTVDYFAAESTSLTTEPTGTETILYTSGGAAENIAPEGVYAIVAYKDRLMISSRVRDSFYEWSKSKVSSDTYGFSDTLVDESKVSGGKIEAFAVLDEKLIMFQKYAIKFISGDGPSDSGANNDYGLPNSIQSDVGVKYPNSVISTPEGIMFQSYKGIWLLDRSMTVSYIGAEVEAYNAEEITGVVLLEDNTEVRFTTRAGVTLCYNYLFKHWTTFTNHEAIGCANWQNKFLHVTSAGTWHQETTNYTDNGSNIQMSIETGWIALDSMLGYQRVWEMELLGQNLSSHTLSVEIAYDYETAFSQTITFASTNIASGAPLRYRIKPAKQKCSAIKLRIKDTSASGAAFDIVGVLLEVGIKKSMLPTRAAQSK